MKRKVYITVMILCAVIFAICLGTCLQEAKDRKTSEEKMADLRPGEHVVVTEVPSSTNPPEVIPSERVEEETAENETLQPPDEDTKTIEIKIPDLQLDWEKIKTENDDIYAWIYIPNTKVDYPVLQHKTDDSYYLNYNMDGTKGYPGCIYTEKINSKEFSDRNTVLYGHNMKNGTMFAGLHEFEDNIFFEENKYIYIYTSQKNMVYEIFGAYEFNDKHLLYNYDFSSDEGYEKYLEEIKNIRGMNAHIRDVGLNKESKIITLSTCIKGKDDKRYLVQGVLKYEE